MHIKLKYFEYFFRILQIQGGFGRIGGDFALYLKMPGHFIRRYGLDFDREDKPLTQPLGVGIIRSFPNIIIIRTGNLFAAGSNQFMI